ncbi:MAG: M48 family metallopeptidase [Cyanobacteria bacterium P01_D01_bin.123]
MRSFPPAPPSESDRNPPTSNFQLIGVIGTFVVGFMVILAALNWLVSNLVWFVPYEVEVQLGRAIAPIYEAQAETDSPVAAELDRLLDELEVNLPSEFGERDYRILYVDDDTVNAAAIPGDRVIIYRGLLAEAESENELMMVLGHELGHFVNRDHLRGITRQFALQTASAIVFGDASGLATIGASIGETLASAQFSQSQELQADTVGLDLLHAHYGHAGGATAFFDRLSESPAANLAFLASHPVPKRRVRALKNLIRQREYARADLDALSGPLADIQE